MAEEIFIPHNNNELYEMMHREQFTGQLSIEESWLVWRLPNGIIVKVAFDNPLPEAYLSASYSCDQKEISLTHWHPYIEDVYRDLSAINQGRIFWVRRKHKRMRFLFGNHPVMMYQEKWEKFSERKKDRYVVP